MCDPSNKPAPDLFDPALLARARVPDDMPLDRRRLIFLWQPPSAATLTRIRRRYPGVPIIVGRFYAESPVAEADLEYWSPADFFPTRTLIDFELASLDATTGGGAPHQPTYLGMPLVDGNLLRFGCWNEMVACAATFLAIRGAVGPVEVVTDWMGAGLIKGVGLKPRRLWRADFADPNWPVRRWLRESMRGERGPWRTLKADPGAAPPLDVHQGRNRDLDAVFLIGNWVEPRLLDVFPIDALAGMGRRCVLWVHQRSPALDELTRRTGVRCEQIDFPLAASDTGPLERRVARWCEETVGEGCFAPLRGELARRVVRLMNWPRWASKLVAMHRLLTARLERDCPRLLIAPAEKDWSAYCGHHAARRLGIPSVGMKHGIWIPGSHFERFGDRLFFPAPAFRTLAYTPADEAACRRRRGESDQMVVWRGNPRIDELHLSGGTPAADGALRILVGARGMGPNQSIGLRRQVVPKNVELIAALFDRIGERLSVRLHPWDSPEKYPPRMRALILPAGQDLDQQLAAHAAVVATYSNVGLDAASAGKPVFLWDHAGLDLDACEIAVEGGAVVTTNLDELCDAVARFVRDADYRGELQTRAARFPRYLLESLPGPLTDGDSMTDQLARWLDALARSEPEPAPSRDSVRTTTRTEEPHECVRT